MSILLKVLPPAVPGSAYARTLQGNTAAGVAGSGFLASDALTATVSPGQQTASIFAPTVTWANAASCQFVVSMSAAQTTLLSIDATYLLEVFAARGSGDPWPIAAAYLPTLPVVGSQAAASPPDLVSLPFAAQLLAQLNLNEAQWEVIPTLITASSSAIRKYCARSFTQGTYVEQVPVELDGTIRLREFPVNQVNRIQCYPSVALTVTNVLATSAWVSQAFTGSVYDNLTITGMALNWQSGGATYSQTITYTSDMTIAALASAIGAVGNGWSASADPVLGLWPVTEIYDGVGSKGAGPNDEPDGSAQFNVFAENVTNGRPHPDDGERTGVWWIGRQIGPDDGPRWGPDWAAWDISNQPSTARVKVTYDGGFAVVPQEIQLACVELAKFQLERLRTDPFLMSENASDYSYTLNNQMLMALPPYVLQALSRYRAVQA